MGSFGDPLPASALAEFTRVRPAMHVVDDPVVRREMRRRTDRSTPAVRTDYDVGLWRLVRGRAYVIRETPPDALAAFGAYVFRGYFESPDGDSHARILLFESLRGPARPLVFGSDESAVFTAFAVAHRTLADREFDGDDAGDWYRRDVGMRRLFLASARANRRRYMAQRHAERVVGHWRARTYRPSSGSNAGGAGFRAAMARFRS